MLLTEFSSYGDIRAALGVSDDEIEDTTLSLELYRDNLELELLDLDLTLVERFTPFIGADIDDLTPVERRFVQAVKLFSTYAVAKQLSTTLPLFSPKDITDGKASISRYADSPYKKVIEGVNALYEKYRGWAESALAGLNASSVTAAAPRVLFLASTPARDPVTGT